jgi:hypothetical protein
MRSRARTAVPLLALACLLPATPLAGQVVWGVHATRANEFGGGSWGGGVQLGLDVPVLPVSVLAAADYLFPDCGAAGDCSFWGGSLDANLALPFPVVHPYATGGVVYRHFDTGDDAEATGTSGLALGLGVQVSLLALRAYVEGRYEFVNAPDDQVVWRIGLHF